VKYLTTAENDDDRGRISTASLVLNFLLSIINVILLIALAGPLAKLFGSELIRGLFYIYTITTLVMIPMQHFNFVQFAHLDFVGPTFSNFFRGGALFIYIAFLYFSSAVVPLANLAYVQIVAAVVGSIVSYLFARKYFKFSKSIDWNWVSTLWRYGRFTFLTNLSTMLYKSIDKWMLGALLTPASVAIYDVCIRVNNLLEAPTQAIAQVVFPQSARKGESEGPEAIKKLYEGAVGAILALIIPAIIFVLLFPKLIVVILGGDEYAVAASILTVTVFYALFLPFANQFGTILDSIGKPETNLFFTLLGAVINVIANLIFILQFGVIGAAYGTMCTYIITFILNQVVLNRMFKVQWWNAFTAIPSFYVMAFGIIFGRNKIKTQEEGLSVTLSDKKEEAVKH